MTPRPIPHWPSFSRVQRQRDAMREVLGDLSDRTLRELLQRAGESPRPLEEGPGKAVADGFPSASSGSGEGHGASPSTDTATERAVLRDNRARSDEDHPERDEPDRWESPLDPIGDSLSEFFSLLAEATGVLRQLDRRRAQVLATAVDLRGPARLIRDCECCGRGVAGGYADPIRAGFCDACRKAWVRAGRPERPAWIAQRRKKASHNADIPGNVQVREGA